MTLWFAIVCICLAINVMALVRWWRMRVAAVEAATFMSEWSRITDELQIVYGNVPIVFVQLPSASSDDVYEEWLRRTDREGVS